MVAWLMLWARGRLVGWKGWRLGLASGLGLVVGEVGLGRVGCEKMRPLVAEGWLVGLEGVLLRVVACVGL